MNSLLLFLSLVSVVVIIILLPLLPSENPPDDRFSEVVSCYTFPSALVILGNGKNATAFSQKDPSDLPPIPIDLSTSSESWTFSQFLAFIVAPVLFSGNVDVQRNAVSEMPTFHSNGKVNRFLFDRLDPLISTVSFEEVSSPENYLKDKPLIGFLGPKDLNQLNFKRSGPHLLAYFAGKDVCTVPLIVAKNLTSDQQHCNGFQLVQNSGDFGIGTKFCNCFDTCGQWFEGDACDKYVAPDQFVGCPEGEITILYAYDNEESIQVENFGTVSPKKCTPHPQAVFFRHGSNNTIGNPEDLTNNSIIGILQNFNVSYGDTINYTQGNTTCVLRMEAALTQQQPRVEVSPTQQQPSPTRSPSSSPCAIDSDGDSTMDCDDECEHDDQKVVSGICGCGVLDNDSDGDSTMDCIDVCPNDPNKAVSSGNCGCGIAENCTISSPSTSISLSSSPSASVSFTPSMSTSPSSSPSTSISLSSSRSASVSFTPSMSTSPSSSPSTSISLSSSRSASVSFTP